MIGSRINEILELGAVHALYSVDGTWYHQLTEFPGILFDCYGYLLVPSEESYQSNKLLKRKKDLHIKNGISSIPGYKSFTSEQAELIKVLIPRDTLKPQRSRRSRFIFNPSGTYELKNVIRSGQFPSNDKEIQQIHREVCNNLYQYLCSEFTIENISCDCPTGNGTYIDIIRKDKSIFHLYEIKTYKDVRRSIREALGQLLEYAYWNFDADVGELIIVSHKSPGQSIKKYLSHLRNRFSLPVYYQQFDRIKRILLNKV